MSYAGHDPTEPRWGETVKAKSLAIAQTTFALNRYRRLRDASRTNPPAAAPRPFPYLDHRTCEEWAFPQPKPTERKGPPRCARHRYG